MVVHHSRDTVAKQWNETIVIALKVVVRVVQTYFPRIMATLVRDDRSRLYAAPPSSTNKVCPCFASE